MRRKPDDAGYSVIYPEVQAEPKRPLWVLLGAIGQLEGTISGPFCFSGYTFALRLLYLFVTSEILRYKTGMRDSLYS